MRVWLGLLVVLAALLVATLLTGCRVSTDDVALHPPANSAISGPSAADASGPEGVGDDALAAVGPIPLSSHWHAAYVVRICNDVLEPFDSDDDPLGIHSHGDGVMHVHPFVEQSAYENATLGLFADAMGLGLDDGELRLPSGGIWRDGDLCDGVPGRVFVDRWAGPDPESSVERHFVELNDLRFLADGELYQIAFAPADSLPVVPPSVSLLPELSDLGPPVEPWVDLDPSATVDQVELWQVGSVEAEPCDGGLVPERVVFGPVRCFEPIGATLTAGEAVEQARAVTLNRQPAIEVQMAPRLVDMINEHFAQSSNPFTLAISVDGFVATAPQLARPPVGDRLVVSGGLSVEAAQQLATLLGGR